MLVGMSMTRTPIASVRLAAQLFEDLSEIKVLFVGAGEMIELVSTHFAAKAPRAMAVANRTLERGEKLAGHLGAEALRLAHSGSPVTPDQVARLTAARTAFDELAEVYEALRRMVERGYVVLK